MKTMRLALFLILAAAPPSGAQDADPADIVIASTTLRDADTQKAGPFAAGALIDVSVTLRNDGEDAVSMRRITLRADLALTVIDPASDTLDNDGNGETDEDDEAFRRRGEGGDAWRFDGRGQRLDPGDTLTRILRIRVADTALPGTAPALAFSAGSTLSEGERSRPQSTLHTIEIALVAPILSLESSESVEVSVLSEPVLTGEVVLPGGTLADARVTMTFPPAMKADFVRSYRVGKAIECEREPRPVARRDRATLRLGSCTIDGARSASDRTVRLAVPLTLKDAAVDADAEALAEWRALSVLLELSDDGAIIGRETLDMTLRGPRIETGMTVPTGKRHRVGDPVMARLTVENRGNLPLVASRVTVTNGEAFRCISGTFGEDDTARPCDGQALLLPTVDPDDTLNLTMTLRLREDALFETGTGPMLELTGDTVAAYPFPAAPVAMALHDAPSLAIAERGDLTTEDTETVATIGDAARLRLRGALPPGRYRGQVRLMSRVLAFQTGAPVGPAPLDIADASLTISTLEGMKITGEAEYSTREGPLWTEHILAFDLREDAANAKDKRLFTADIAIALADDPRLIGGRVIELTAETDAYGASTMTGNTWVAILIEEPDIHLKLISLDTDRIVEPDERFGVVSLACNYGDSSAHGAVLSLDTSRRIDLLSKETRTKVFTVPLDAAREGQIDDIDAERTMLDGVAARVHERSVTLVYGDAPLAPDACFGIELVAPLTADLAGTDTTASILAALDAYGGRADAATARRYPGSTTEPLRFQTQTLRLGPSTTIQLGNDATIAHPVELSVPERLGPFRVSFEALSSTGLDWALFAREQDGDEDDETAPWTDGKTYPAGSTIRIVMKTETPATVPLGWVDTSRLRAAILTEDAQRLDAALRLVIRTGTGSARAIDTDKRVALDRDCDGTLTDERAQDALFESGKDALPGDCFIVRIGFENTGTREVEKIVIRDALSSRTTLVPDSASVRIAPEPLDDVTLPADDSGILEWEFRGLFRPGAVGEVEYRLRLE